jgi:hypothetical protein
MEKIKTEQMMDAHFREMMACGYILENNWENQYSTQVGDFTIV